MRTEHVPDKTLTELEEDGELDDIKSREEAREEISDYYDARDELDEVIELTEATLDDEITLREMWSRLDALGDEDGKMALDRI